MMFTIGSGATGQKLCFDESNMPSPEEVEEAYKATMVIDRVTYLLCKAGCDLATKGVWDKHHQAADQLQRDMRVICGLWKGQEEDE